MKKLDLNIIFIFLVFLQITNTFKSDEYLRKFCDQIENNDNRFFDQRVGAFVEVNILKEFENGYFYGEKEDYSETKIIVDLWTLKNFFFEWMFLNENKLIRSRKVLKSDHSIAEVEILNKLKDEKFVQKFVGCVFDQTHVYIFDEHLETEDFEDCFTLKSFRDRPRIERLEIYIKLFESINIMQNLGIVNSRISNKSLKLNIDKSELIITDFSRAKEIGSKIDLQKPNLFASPNQFFGHNQNSEMDDLYSTAAFISFCEWFQLDSDVLMENELTEPLIEPFQSDNYLFLCNFIVQTEFQLTQNGFGASYFDRNGNLNSKDINFTTLISGILRFKEFPFTSDQVVKILKSLILTSKTNFLARYTNSLIKGNSDQKFEWKKKDSYVNPFRLGQFNHLLSKITKTKKAKSSIFI